MKEKILALLIAKFTGVRKDGLSQLARTLALQAATDDEAKALTDKLTKEQVDLFVKDYRAEVDKEVSEGNKTYETNLKKKFDLVEKKVETPPASGASGDPADVTALIKAAVAEAMKPLQTELAGYKANEVGKTRLQTLSEKLKDCADENFKAQKIKDFGRMRFETDEEFNEYLTDAEQAVTAANQNYSNSRLGATGKPYVGSPAGTAAAVLADIKEWSAENAPKEN